MCLKSRICVYIVRPSEWHSPPLSHAFFSLLPLPVSHPLGFSWRRQRRWFTLWIRCTFEGFSPHISLSFSPSTPPKASTLLLTHFLSLCCLSPLFPKAAVSRFLSSAHQREIEAKTQGGGLLNNLHLPFGFYSCFLFLFFLLNNVPAGCKSHLY